MDETKPAVIDELKTKMLRAEAMLKQDKFYRGNADMWLSGVCAMLERLFGASSPTVKALRERVLKVRKGGVTKDEFAKDLQVLTDLVTRLELLSDSASVGGVSLPSPWPQNNRVFVIHGHDELNTRRLTMLLDGHFGITPIMIQSRPGMSRVLLDKYEDDASRCSFAFALFTPDDTVVDAESRHQQARPNVVFETGWFVGRLSRQRVVLLVKDEVRIHSDLDGISRIHFRDNIEEKVLEIERELIAAGFTKR